MVTEPEMSLHTAMMSNSRTSRPGFLRRLIWCALFVLGIAGFLALVNVYQVNLSPLFMTVFSILVVGLTAGAAARTSFYGWSVWIRFLAMLMVLPGGLFALGFFTNWQMGIGPLGPWLEGAVDSYQLAQLGGAFLVAAIALVAWGKPAVKLRNGIPEAAQITPQSVGHARSLHARVSENPNPPPKINPFLRFMKAARPRSRPKSRGEKLVLPRTARYTRSGLKQLFRRKPNVQVSLYAEHRCPFCLEVVKRHDPRGVKRCEVCNTLHHADCWEVTGTCQVPHLNT
jgi:ribosomal protein L37AE/L43A